MTARDPSFEAGFTLVEMLIALSIFALLAAAGTGLLRASVDTQAAAGRKLEAIGSIGRVHALLASDVGQAVQRPPIAGQAPLPAFTGEATRFELVRTGWLNPGDAPRANLQRVIWQGTAGGLQRTGNDQLGRGQPGLAATLGRGLGQARFRYRRADGSWADSFRSDPEQPLPTAVEVMIATRTGPLVMLFASPPQPGRAG